MTAEGSAAATNAVDLPVERLVLLFHLLDRFHGRVAARLRFLFRGEFGLLPLIAGFALRLGLDEAALLHGARGRAEKSERDGVGKKARDRDVDGYCGLEFEYGHDSAPPMAWPPAFVAIGKKDGCPGQARA